MGQSIQCSFQRYEKKYLLTEHQQAAFLEGMQPYMEPDRYGKTVNCNIYYDTDRWDLVRRSIEKPVYKEKLRVRSYGVPASGEPVFVEIKKKYGDVVYKRRMTMPVQDAEACLAGDVSLAPAGQIASEIEWFQRRYRAVPKVYIAYDRTSFAGIRDSALRITFDRNIRFRENDLDLRLGDRGQRMLPEDSVLMEIKIPGAAPLWLAELLSELKIRPASFSKYGTYYKNYVITKEYPDHVSVPSARHCHASGICGLHGRVADTWPAECGPVPV